MVGHNFVLQGVLVGPGRNRVDLEPLEYPATQLLHAFGNPVGVLDLGDKAETEIFFPGISRDVRGSRETSLERALVRFSWNFLKGFKRTLPCGVEQALINHLAAFLEHWLFIDLLVGLLGSVSRGLSVDSVVYD